MNSDLERYVKEAKNGNLAALDQLVKHIKDNIYGLAFRMLGHPEDAEDQTHEILIKVITHLSSFREESAFTTWVYRIACNHLISKQSKVKSELTFESFGELIANMTEQAPTLEASDPERSALLEETRLSCLQAMLSCLDKESRLIFILSESYGVTSQEGALILDITPDAYRARLSRGKKLLQQFMDQRCGLINKNNSCQCHQPAAIRLQHQSGVKSSISCSAQLSSKKGRAELLAQLDEFEEIERVIAMFRLYPEYDSPDSFSHIVSNLMESGRYQVLN
ncbi:hypothetical protein BIY21_08595 [Vibrio ponticus]|uniref:RNA polymerase sigma factor n=1 Tax=Vibrio ponticus TaxID=265668 RepID=A0ABX3FQ38_9VIBR|nr:RNA polymerase sigma factor [Vibrio ponticus]OLQ94533.1 hypothetical protein BIY21_08595 [Vibrio ponticus]